MLAISLKASYGESVLSSSFQKDLLQKFEGVAEDLTKLSNAGGNIVDLIPACRKFLVLTYLPAISMLKSTLCYAVVSDLVSWGFGHSKCFGVSQSNERNNGYPCDRVEEQEGESFLLITVWLTITRAIMMLGRRKDGSMFHIERIRRL